MGLGPWTQENDPVCPLFTAAFAAGAINSIAGGGTLITFPVLIWLGLDPKVANATSTVALWPGLFGGLFGYRRELENSSKILLRLGLTSVIGGAVGAWLLIWTPSPDVRTTGSLSHTLATVLFMAQGTITRACVCSTIVAEPKASWCGGRDNLYILLSITGRLLWRQARGY